MVIASTVPAPGTAVDARPTSRITAWTTIRGRCGERVPRQPRRRAGLHPRRRVLRRGRDRPGVAARQPGAAARRTSTGGAASGWPSWWPTPTGSSRPSRSASRWPASCPPGSARRACRPRSRPCWWTSACRPGVADAVAFVAVTVLLVYLSLVFGELTPKRIGLQRAETIAVGVAGLIDWLARITRPFIWLLSASTNVVVRALGGDPNANREEISRGRAARHPRLAGEPHAPGARAHRRRLRGRRARGARGDGAAHRGRVPRRHHARLQGRAPRRRPAALALPGVPGLAGRHRRLRAHPRHPGPRRRRPRDPCRRPRPRDPHAAGQQARAPRHVRDALRGSPPGHRRRRVRRHRRHRHARGPRRGARRRHPRRVRPRRAPRARRWAPTSRSTAWSTSRTSLEETGVELPDGPVRDRRRVPDRDPGPAARGGGVRRRRRPRPHGHRARRPPGRADPADAGGRNRVARPTPTRWENPRHECHAARPVRDPAHRGLVPARQLPRARCGTGWRCRTTTTRSTWSSTCTRSPWSRTRSSCGTTPCSPTRSCIAAGVDPTARPCSCRATSRSTPSSAGSCSA